MICIEIFEFYIKILMNCALKFRVTLYPKTVLQNDIRSLHLIKGLRKITPSPQKTYERKFR
jgi:hypothetical protein